jgi:hypothetical protein
MKEILTRKGGVYERAIGSRWTGGCVKRKIVLVLAVQGNIVTPLLGIMPRTSVIGILNLSWLLKWEAFV